MVDPRELFMSKVVIDPTTGCWRWTGAILQSSTDAYRVSGGYGIFKPSNGKTARAHRWSYEAFVGPIPAGMTLDHTCHTQDQSCEGGDTCLHRRCVNPQHLQPMSRKQNVLLGGGPTAVNAVKTHCIHGHEFTEANTYWYADHTMRSCRTCSRERARVKRDSSDPARFRRRSPKWVLEQENATKS